MRTIKTQEQAFFLLNQVKSKLINFIIGDEDSLNNAIKLSDEIKSFLLKDDNHDEINENCINYLKKQNYFIEQRDIEYENKAIIEEDKTFKERILDSPLKYSLQECLRELKFGRPAETQRIIDSFINGLDSLPKTEE